MGKHDTSRVTHYAGVVAACRRAGGDPLDLAHAVRHLGDSHRDVGQVDRARQCYDEALAIYRSRSDAKPLDLANAIRGLAVLEDDLDRRDEATRLWSEAHELYASLSVHSGVAESAARLALLAMRAGDEAKAREWLGLAEVAAERSGDAESIVYVTRVAAKLGG